MSKKFLSKAQLKTVDDRILNLLYADPALIPHRYPLRQRLIALERAFNTIQKSSGGLSAYAAGHEFFGLHQGAGEWIFREWAPNAEAIYLIGSFSGWKCDPRYEMNRAPDKETWEIRLPLETLKHLDLYRLVVFWPGGKGDRIPAFARCIHRDPETLVFNAQVWQPDPPYRWKYKVPDPPPFPLIYEAHVGMAQDREGIGCYSEFTTNILPRIAAAGYNTLQLMALQEHPYYASFGYHVSSFFSPATLFGSPDDLKELIDTAHHLGLFVLMDMVHSHAVLNEVEGLSRFDGSEYQYFHEGPRGRHPAWGSRCFDYGKPQVLHFLLSNCRFWLDEYRIDGFRFDGVTSMLFHHHGLNRTFATYDDYFKDDVDLEALVYLGLANRLIHHVRPDAITIAEDVSGYPGLAVASNLGGIGFDFRFAMGIPDYWIRLIKDCRDDDWDMGELWFELNNRRKDEKTISYAEAHDQALVGDQSLIFRLAGDAIYTHMKIEDEHIGIDRAVALHKLIRLITLATAGNGYLNFIGNEFGHPEWIDFPREGNNWSYRYARRQWHLVDDPALKYAQLFRFDNEMIRLATSSQLLENATIELRHEHNQNKILAFERADLFFAFNFNAMQSFPDYTVAASSGTYQHILDSDDKRFGGHQRLNAGVIHFTRPGSTKSAGLFDQLSLYLPSRTAIVLKKVIMR